MMRNIIKKFLKDETGLELSEYAVAAALLAVGISILFTNLGSTIGVRISQLRSSIS